MRFHGARLCAFACVVLGGLAQPALAAEAKSGAKLGFLVEGDIEYGGDDIVTVSFKDGSTQDIKAGQGATLALGGYFKPEESSPFSVRATVGYKFVTTAASNADIGINRIVYELVGNYDWPNGWHVGAGLTRHTNIKFDADGFGRNVDFDDATGFTAEFGWKWLSLSYTGIDYKDEFGGKWDAGSVGLAFAWRF
jgi:hypothetical protein